MEPSEQLQHVLRLLNTEQVAQRLGVSRFCVRRLAASGQLRAIRFGCRGHLRFPVEEVERLIGGE
jgi:excisionase family DNA binding protein